MAGLQLDNVYQPFSKLFQWLHRHAATAGASSPDSRQQPPDFVIGGVTEKFTAMRIDSDPIGTLELSQAPVSADV